jgi:hypothetical protein
MNGTESKSPGEKADKCRKNVDVAGALIGGFIGIS